MLRFIDGAGEGAIVGVSSCTVNENSIQKVAVNDFKGFGEAL